MAVLVDLERVSARSPDRSLFEDLSLTVSDGDRIGIVGINGTGKSTLLKVIAGRTSPDSGQVRRGRGVRTSYLDQEPEVVHGTVRGALGGGWESEAILERLGMGGSLDLDVSSLSGGQAKRVALATVLSESSELLILDEPTNHLDLAAVNWLESFLATYSGGVVLVSHDRHLLDRITTRMVELDRGSRFIHDGGYASYLDAKIEREIHAASADAVRRNLARRELAWLRRGAQARSTKAKARVESANRLVAQRPVAAARSGELALKIGTPRLGDKVLEVNDVTFAHTPERQPVLAHVDLSIGPNERLGVVGMNGTGKSTLLDLLAGRIVPTLGFVDRGTTVVVGYYDQLGVELDPTARLQDLVAGPNRKPGSLEDQALMERFWFTGDLPFAPVGTLSGGERRRLQLLLVLARRPNVLLLDEPTNDLDLDTLRILEEFLEDWAGALVVVSHDRTFLERTTDRVVALSGDATVTPVAGGVAAWVASVASLPTKRSTTPRTPERGGSRSPSVRDGPSSSTLHRQIIEVEKVVTRLQRQREKLHTDLAGTSEYEELGRLSTILTALQSELDAAEERWLELHDALEKLM